MPHKSLPKISVLYFEKNLVQEIVVEISQLISYSIVQAQNVSLHSTRPWALAFSNAMGANHFNLVIYV